MPIEIDRSNGPTKMPSTPSTAQMSSMMASASAVSHCGKSRVSPLKWRMVSGTEPSPSKPQPSLRDGQKPRWPMG